ncbi:helix-turn-helix domain-containing protein [Pseudomonas juntendi]|nr:helix-turn-helix domain-containing protein [Pseudomonas juntendi]
MANLLELAAPTRQKEIDMSQALPLPVLSVGPDEAGRMTGHSRCAIYKAIACGDLKSFKPGKRRLILVTELHAWINRLAKETTR